MKRVVLGLAILISGLVSAHTCCYSRTVTTYLIPSADDECTVFMFDLIEWKEYQPTSSDPNHGHEWVTGSYWTGPHGSGKNPDCEYGF